MDVSIRFLKPRIRDDMHLVDLREQAEREESTEDAQRAGDKEWILTRANLIGGIILDNGQDVGAHESANLTNGGSVRVVLTTDGSGAALGCTKAKVVARAKLTQRKEDAITSYKREPRAFE